MVERGNILNYVVLSISDHLPFKMKHLLFNRFSYHIIKDKNTNIPSLLLYDDGGFLFDLSLQKTITSRFFPIKKEEIVVRNFLSESYEVTPHLPTEEVLFNSENKLKLSPNEYWLQKAHEKQIVIGTKLNLEIIAILTISKDGVIKLWNQKCQVLFVLKIPSLLKLVWNMK